MTTALLEGKQEGRKASRQEGRQGEAGSPPLPVGL